MPSRVSELTENGRSPPRERPRSEVVWIQFHDWVNHPSPRPPHAGSPAPDCRRSPITYPLRLPTSLKVAVAEISKADGTSINQFVATAVVAEKVSVMRTAEFFTALAAQADVEAARRLLRREGGQPPEPEDQLE